MPITLNCPKCKKPFRVRDQSVGRKVRCPACTVVLQVPASLAPSSLAVLDLDEPRGEKLSASTANAPTIRAEPTLPPMREEPIGDSENKGSYADLGIDSPDDDPFHAGHHGNGKGSSATGATAPVGKAPPKSDLAQTAVNRQPEDRGRETAAMRTPAARPLPKPRAKPAGLPPQGDLSALASGLKLVHIGIFFLILPFLGFLGEAIYTLLNPLTDKLQVTQYMLLPVGDPQEPGIFGIKHMSTWEEVRLLCVVLPLLAFWFLVIPGRLKCLKAPAVTQSRSLALASLVFTILGMVAILVAVVADVTASPGGSTAKLIAGSSLAGAAFAVTGEVCFCMFVAHLGWPLQTPQLGREAAWFLATVVITPMAILIAQQFYTLFGIADINAMANRPKGPIEVGDIQDLRSQRMLLGSSAMLIVGVLISFRYTALVSMARKGVARFGKPETA